MKKVTILIPCYNEEASLPHLYKALCKLTSECLNYEWEFLFVNDGSHDNTLQIIKGLRKDGQQGEVHRHFVQPACRCPRGISLSSRTLLNGFTLPHLLS